MLVGSREEDVKQQQRMMANNEFSNSEYSHAKAFSMALAAKLAYENTNIIKVGVICEFVFYNRFKLSGTHWLLSFFYVLCSAKWPSGVLTDAK